jgi:hypothetical protein
VDQNMVMPPAVIVAIVEVCVAAVIAVDEVVGFALPGGLVAAVGLAVRGPDRGGEAQLGRDGLGVPDIQWQGLGGKGGGERAGSGGAQKALAEPGCYGIRS